MIMFTERRVICKHSVEGRTCTYNDAAGAFDAQDGPAGQEAWIHKMDWHGAKGFAESRRHIWRADKSGNIPELQGPGLNFTEEQASLFLQT